MNAIGFAVVAVITDFMLKIDYNVCAACQPDGKSDQVDQCVCLPAYEIADCGGKIVLDHDNCS